MLHLKCNYCLFFRSIISNVSQPKVHYSKRVRVQLCCAMTFDLVLFLSRGNKLMSEEHELSRKVVDSFSNSQFNSSWPTKFIIHGFTHSSHEPWVQSMKDELLKSVSLEGTKGGEGVEG